MESKQPSMAVQGRDGRAEELHSHGVPDHVAEALAATEKLRLGPWDSFLASDCPSTIDAASANHAVNRRDQTQLQLSGLVQGGIPRMYRGAMWRAFLDLDSLAEPGLYAKYCEDVLRTNAPPSVFERPQLARTFTAESEWHATSSDDEDLNSTGPITPRHLWPELEDGSLEASDGDIPVARAVTVSITSERFWHDVALSSPVVSMKSSMTGDANSSAADVGCSYTSSPADQLSPDAAVMRRQASQGLRAIELDIDRTFPDHPFMGDHSNRIALFRILSAYASRNPEVGYCQGMNLLGCIALMVMHSEEEAFWCLAGLVELLLPGYFRAHSHPSQADPVKVDVSVLQQLVTVRHPDLAAHMAAANAPLQPSAVPWMMSAFASCMPLQTVLRLWDVMFYERNPSILFRTALTILDLVSEDLTSACDSSDMYSILDSFISELHMADRLLIVASSKFCGVTGPVIEDLRYEVRQEMSGVVQAMEIELVKGSAGGRSFLQALGCGVCADICW